jgi:hypothetical protein
MDMHKVFPKLIPYISPDEPRKSADASKASWNCCMRQLYETGLSRFTVPVLKDMARKRGATGKISAMNKTKLIALILNPPGKVGAK